MLCAAVARIAFGDLLAKAVSERSAGLLGASQQSRRLDLVERAVRRNVAARLVDPVGRICGAWKPHGLGERLIDIA